MTVKTGALSFALLLGNAVLSTPQISKAPPRGEETEQARHQEYARLSNQIYSYEDPESQRVHISGKDEVAAVVAKMEDIVREQVEGALASKNPTPSAIVGGVKAVQGDLTLFAFLSPNGTNTPFSEFSELKGSPALLVAYTVLRGGAGIPNSLPVLDFYTKTGGKWELRATAPPDLTSSGLFVHRMDAALAGEVWYLAEGNRLGDTGSRLGIYLYAFDGNAVRTVWKRDELTHGSMEQVTGKSIKFSYEKVYNSGERTEETLYITPNGLQ